MNISIVTSFVIGGFLLISILTLSNFVSRDSAETLLDFTTNQRVANIVEILGFDFPKIGYADADSATSPTFEPITSFDPTRIVFISNIDNSSDGSIETITWELTSTSVPETKNPNDYILRRTVSGISTTEMYVTQFGMKYYNAEGNVTAVKSDIRYIDISMECQSVEAVGDKYAKTIWSKRFAPRNLLIYN